ncbi:NUDIX hydrolase [Olivibacter sp. XZL3]|uniref:NUDIX domain-containing protein n=1 Tax=Olivibacter sp. XZL3 TaxID=1735116 RepID=UPI0010660E03|nr:NUDIX hydrolase [Olivibacter sp. XZL3]
MYTYKHQRPALTVDILLFHRGENQEWHILLIKRKQEPFKDQWAFPGGFVDIDEKIDAAAFRELEEETGITNLNLERLGIYDDPDRDPRGRTISIAYIGILDEQRGAIASDDALEAEWFAIDKLPHLAFDHQKIMMDGRKKLSSVT